MTRNTLLLTWSLIAALAAIDAGWLCCKACRWRRRRWRSFFCPSLACWRSPGLYTNTARSPHRGACAYDGGDAGVYERQLHSKLSRGHPAPAADRFRWWPPIGRWASIGLAMYALDDRASAAAYRHGAVRSISALFRKSSRCRSVLNFRGQISRVPGETLMAFSSLPVWPASFCPVGYGRRRALSAIIMCS